MYRRDRPLNGNYGGGIVLYVKQSLLCQRKFEYECKSYESIAIELHVGKRKWLCISVYRSPSYSLNGFVNEMESILNRAFCKYDDVILMGDMNVNMLKMIQNKEQSKISGVHLILQT
jgi:hypothetical protein